MTVASDSPAIWSSSDFPYMCLKDERRTRAFGEAIRRTVWSGDTVIDVGAGSGILSLFAASAGARRVHAVEVDPTLAAALRTTVAMNGLSDVVTVVEGDALEADLPRGADVVIAEIIDTGLLDELQAPVLNRLRERGVVDRATRLVPSRYRTDAQLVWTDNLYYGYRIAAPKHEWPFYDRAGDGWAPTSILPVSERVEIALHDFSAGPVDEAVAVAGDVAIAPGLRANALRLSGEITLCDGVTLGATNALNGDKILPLPSEATGRVRLELAYRLGGGLGSLAISALPG
jgi:predicted RNA methylase